MNFQHEFPSEIFFHSPIFDRKEKSGKLGRKKKKENNILALISDSGEFGR